MGVPSWNTSLIETVVEAWYLPLLAWYQPLLFGKVYPLPCWHWRYWFGKRWFVVRLAGGFHDETEWTFYSHRQRADNILREEYGTEQ